MKHLQAINEFYMNSTKEGDKLLARLLKALEKEGGNFLFDGQQKYVARVKKFDAHSDVEIQIEAKSLSVMLEIRYQDGKESHRERYKLHADGYPLVKNFYETHTTDYRTRLRPNLIQKFEHFQAELPV